MNSNQYILFAIAFLYGLIIDLSHVREYMFICSGHYAANSNRSSFNQKLVSHCIIQSIIPKKAKSAAAKAREISTQYVNEFMIIPRNDFYCS